MMARLLRGVLLALLASGPALAQITVLDQAQDAVPAPEAAVAEPAPIGAHGMIPVAMPHSGLCCRKGAGSKGICRAPPHSR